MAKDRLAGDYTDESGQAFVEKQRKSDPLQKDANLMLLLELYDLKRREKTE